MVFQNLTFKNIDNDHIKACFVAAYEKFELLHEHPFKVEQLPLAQYTMRAQPVINAAFFKTKKRHYRIQLSNHLQIQQYVNMERLPVPVLIGWFAHELGHIVDYLHRPPLNMLWFVCRYLTSSAHRMSAERRADCYAIEQGFGKELMATKGFILEQSELPPRYINRIKKYYMSPDELEEILLKRQEALLINSMK